MIPFFLLQFFSDAVLRGLGVDAAIAVKIVIYTRLMCVTSWLLLLEIHLENIFINLGYAKCATFNSLITGVGIDVACSYWFIFELQILALTNIQGIPDAAVAAGAIWVQSESTMAAIQNGWISATQMRSLKLLGKRDPGAKK